MNKKKIIVLVVGIIYLLAILIINNVWLYGLTLLLLGFLLINIIVYRKFSYIATHLFSTIGRNYKQLVIADECNLTSILSERSIALISPTPRSMQAVTLMVQRMYSLIDEEKGELIIAMRNPKETKGIAVFDVHYMHENTLSDLHMKPMKYFCRLPLLFNPFSSLKLLMCKSNALPIEAKLEDKALKEFLDTRNIKYKFYIIK